MSISAFPLQWPTGWKRTAPAHRAHGRFTKGERQYSSTPGGSSWMRQRELTVADSLKRVRAELDRMGYADADFVISSNLELRLDGYPRSGQREPDDAGVAVYWRDAAGMRCMAIDRYHRVADNLAAIAATLDAMRAIERHGGAEILDRAFTGFAALPPPSSSSTRTFRDVLGLAPTATRADAEAAYKRLRSQHHPDRGGDASEFDAVQRAWEQAQAVLR